MRTHGEIQHRPLSDWPGSDQVVGRQFCATMQLRTPLKILKRHGEVFSGSGAPPVIAEELWHGVWMAKPKSFRDLGLDIDEFEGSMASEIGYIPSRGGHFLHFLVAVRTIVETESPLSERLWILLNELRKDQWQAFVEQLGGSQSIVVRLFSSLPARGSALPPNVHP